MNSAGVGDARESGAHDGGVPHRTDDAIAWEARRQSKGHPWCRHPEARDIGDVIVIADRPEMACQSEGSTDFGDAELCILSTAGPGDDSGRE